MERKKAYKKELGKVIKKTKRIGKFGKKLNRIKYESKRRTGSYKERKKEQRKGKGELVG